MAKATNSIEIKRAPADVYRFLADGLNNPKWRPGVVDISLASGTAGSVGAVYKQGVKGPFGRKIDGDYRLVEATLNSRIRFEVIAGPARPTGLFEIEPLAGGSRVRFSLGLEMKGFMRLMDGMVQGTMNGEVQRLSALKQVLEA